MRRTMFRKTVEVHPPAGASVREVLLFDVSDHFESADLTLAERRLGAWTFAPWFLLTGHIAVLLSVLLEGIPRPSWAAMIGTGLPLAASLALDTAAGLMMLYWRRLQMAPHNVVRIMCGYLAATGVLWAFSMAGAGSSQLASASFVAIALASGFFLRSIIAVPSPPLALVNAVVAVIDSALFSHSVQMTFAIDMLALLMVVYSVLITQDTLFSGRKRLAIEVAGEEGAQFRRRVRKQRPRVVLGDRFSRHPVLRFAPAC